MRFRKPLLVAGVAAALAALVVAGSVLAQTPAPTPGSQNAGTNYRDFFMNALASRLGVARDKLNQAFTDARNDTADQAVKDGKITQQQADNIKARPGTEPFGFGFGRRGERAPGIGFAMHGEVFNAIAQALGITPQDLTSKLQSGQTLAQIAQGKEQAVKDAVKNAITPQLDQAVANGRITKDQETQILNNIQNSDLNQLGGMGLRGPKGPDGMMGRGHWPGANNPTPTPQPSA